MSTFSDGEEQLSASQVGFAWAMCIICLVGIVTNTFLLSKLSKFVKTTNLDSRPHYRFLKFLFGADLLMCLTNAPMFMSTAVTRYISSTSFLCLCQSVLALVFATASILLLVCLSYDRYLLVVKQTIMQKSTSHKLLGIAWFLAILIGTLILIPAGGFSYGISSSGAFCSSLWWERGWGVLHPVFSSIILLGAIVISSFHYYEIHKHAQNARNNIGSITRSQFRRDQKHTAVAMNMLLLVCVFVFDWITYLLVIMIQMVSGSPFTGSLSIIDILGTFFGFFNSAINPIVYAYLNRKKLREDSRRLIRANIRRLEQRATLPRPKQHNNNINESKTSDNNGAQNIIRVQVKPREQRALQRTISVGRDRLIFNAPKQPSPSESKLHMEQNVYKIYKHTRQRSLPDLRLHHKQVNKNINKRRQSIDHPIKIKLPMVLNELPQQNIIVDIQPEIQLPKFLPRTESPKISAILIGTHSHSKSSSNKSARIERHRVVKITNLPPVALKTTKSIP